MTVETTPSTPPIEHHHKRRELRRWVLRIGLALTVLAPLTFMLGAVGAKLGLWSWQFGLGILTMKVGPILLMACLAFGVIGLLLAVIIKPRHGVVMALAGILVGLLGMGKLANTQKTVAALPFIHDVTTDTQNVPVFGEVIMAERQATKGVNSADYIGKKDSRDKKLVAALQTKAFPDIRPLVLDEPRDIVFGQALVVAQAQGWEIKAEDSAAGRIDATDTTFWYGFKDDVTIRLRDSQGGGTIVDVRSLSRVGGSDIGKNADRVREFLDALGAN